MAYLFTSESVSEGHPDKVADQISDSILDAFLSQDPNARVACETLVTTGLAVVSGEVRSDAYVDVQKTVRETIRKIGYNKSELQFDADSCGVISAIHEQSADIAQGVDAADESDIGAGDQGMMFGFATNETDQYMPLPLQLSHMLLKELADIRKNGAGEMSYLRPDSKSQVTVVYDDNGTPINIDTIVLSTQHDDFAEELLMRHTITEDFKKILLPRVLDQLSESQRTLFNGDITTHINPTGKFVIGGPHGDTGLTGRKIIVDTYGGQGAHGGGAFSGKDPSKVDRSAAYATRHIAKNLVAAGVANKCLVQVAYAIGVSQPVGLYVNTYGTAKIDMADGEIANKISQMFDLRPGAIIATYGLKNPIYSDTAAYGHMGRTPSTKSVRIQDTLKEVETFTWEKLDRIADIQQAFNL